MDSGARGVGGSKSGLSECDKGHSILDNESLGNLVESQAQSIPTVSTGDEVAVATLVDGEEAIALAHMAAAAWQAPPLVAVIAGSVDLRLCVCSSNGGSEVDSVVGPQSLVGTCTVRAAARLPASEAQKAVLGTTAAASDMSVFFVCNTL